MEKRIGLELRGRKPEEVSSVSEFGLDCLGYGVRAIVVTLTYSSLLFA